MKEVAIEWAKKAALLSVGSLLAAYVQGTLVRPNQSGFVDKTNQVIKMAKNEVKDRF